MKNVMLICVQIGLPGYSGKLFHIVGHTDRGCEDGEETFLLACMLCQTSHGQPCFDSKSSLGIII